MKNLIILILALGTFISNAQKVVTLTVNQPPELSLEVAKQDTTILIGTSVTLGTDLVVTGGSSGYQYSWSPAASLNDSALANPVASPTDTTVYILTVTDLFGCSFSVQYTVNTRGPNVNSEIIPVSQRLQAVLYPNPNEGKFRVRVSGMPSAKIELAISDINGRIIKKQVIRNFNGEHTEMLQLNLAPGAYSLFINSGSEILNRQFIIH
jgi:hypothetical protein